MDLQYSPLSLEEKTWLREKGQNYKNLVRQIQEEIFPHLDATSAKAREMYKLISQYPERLWGTPEGADVLMLAYLFDIATDAKKEIEEDIIKHPPRSLHGEYVCNQCNIKSVYTLDKDNDVQKYYCELCEKIGTATEILIL
ncbi:MAG: hypothetical protein WD876_01175 [Candidatus Pacearchaeota archaeon]